MKIKITRLIITAITLLFLGSCSVSIGGHGRVGHPHHVHGNSGDHD